MNKGRYLYHYFASYQPVEGQVSYLDGVAQTDKRLVSYSDMEELKVNINEDNAYRMTLRSLNYLGREFEDEESPAHEEITVIEKVGELSVETTYKRTT